MRLRLGVPDEHPSALGAAVLGIGASPDLDTVLTEVVDGARALGAGRHVDTVWRRQRSTPRLRRSAAAPIPAAAVAASGPSRMACAISVPTLFAAAARWPSERWGYDGG